jgi:hypothetical protein
LILYCRQSFVGYSFHKVISQKNIPKQKSKEGIFDIVIILEEEYVLSGPTSVDHQNFIQKRVGQFMVRTLLPIKAAKKPSPSPSKVNLRGHRRNGSINRRDSYMSSRTSSIKKGLNIQAISSGRLKRFGMGFK